MKRLSRLAGLLAMAFAVFSVAFFVGCEQLSEQGASISIALPKELGDALARYAAPRDAMSRQAASDSGASIIRISLSGGVERTEDFAWNNESHLTCTMVNLPVGATVTVDVSAWVDGVKRYETKNPPRVTLTEGPNATSVMLTRVGIPLNIKFVRIEGASVTASIGEAGGPFKNASTANPVRVATFDIAETELTYAQWYEVYQWATSGEGRTKGYTFANKGREGNRGTDGAAPTQGSTQPVTYVSWRDAVVWCNAASERAGLSPAYLINGQPVRESEGDSVADGSGKAEQAYVDESANGYRLPTEAEWEFAARGGNPNDAAWGYAWAGSTTVGDVAWYHVISESKTHNVKTKNPNGAGLYDMTGNVWEWCGDTSASSSDRVHRGGSFVTGEYYCTVAVRYNYPPDYRDGEIGFRVVRSVVQQ